VLTSAAVGLLLEEDRLKLDEEIQTYVPEFPKKEWPVTLHQLMGHLAGVRTDGGDEGPLFALRCERPVEGLQVFAERSLLFEPGTEYRYSSYGWIVVSAAVEAAADEPFLPFMRQRIYGGRLLRPATVQLLQTSQRLPSGQETGYGLGWDLETVALAGEQTRVVGHDGEVLGGIVASFMIFPDGTVVAVTSNISYADTRALALKIAQAFAEQARSPERG
jgi:CubicO group peptidase (beta-lactamase class C family)